MSVFIKFLTASIKFSTFFQFGATGETLTEKSGHLNLGTPGIVCMGAACGYWGGTVYMNATGSYNGFLALLIPILFAFVGSALLGLLYSFLTVTLRANQNVTGLMLTTFGLGVAKFIKLSIKAEREAPTVFSSYYSKLFPFADKLGWFGQLFFSYGFLVYLAIAVSVVTSIVLKKTKVGLNIRAVGENPATADAVGINITRYRYLSTIIGSGISGLAGLFFIYENGWDSGLVSTQALGWLSVALVIFSTWSPDKGILGSILFSALYLLPFQSWITGTTAFKDFITMFPYLVTIVVLVLASIRQKRETQPPAALGLSYFREER